MYMMQINTVLEGAASGVRAQFARTWPPGCVFLLVRWPRVLHNTWSVLAAAGQAG